MHSLSCGCRYVPVHCMLCGVTVSLCRVYCDLGFGAKQQGAVGQVFAFTPTLHGLQNCWGGMTCCQQPERICFMQWARLTLSWRILCIVQLSALCTSTHVMLEVRLLLLVHRVLAAALVWRTGPGCSYHLQHFALFNNPSWNFGILQPWLLLSVWCSKNARS